MATRQDLDLARRLLGAGVLDEARVRAALEAQGRLLRQGRILGLDRVLYAMGALPQGSLDALWGPTVEEVQPFAEYRVEARLGQGGASTVWRGTYLPNGTPVAIKVLDPIQALRPAFLERFQHEAGLLVDIEHENVVAGYEVGQQGGWHFYTMDVVEGATVLEVIERRGWLHNHEALSITLQIARALEHLHQRGLLHRDVKPGNAMVDASGWVRLIDLGLVGRMGEAVALAEATTTVGTVEYLSPEQARGRGDLDARADLYSLGVTLYHMVVGEVPFHGATDYEVMAKQILGSLDVQKVKQRRIEPEVQFLIAKMCAKDRSERYASARDVIRVIEGYLPGGRVPVDLGTPPAVAAAGAGGPVSPPVLRPMVPPGASPPRGRRGPASAERPPRRRRRR